MEKIRKRLYLLVLLLTLVSLALSLFNSGYQRVFFYLAIYVSILGLLLENKKITFPKFSITYPILILGLAKVVWYFIYQFPYEGIDFYNNHLSSGKKLILGGFLIFYLEHFKSYITPEQAKKWLFIFCGIGFILATGLALWQASNHMIRVEMAINRATMSAYVYSLLSQAFIYMLYLNRSKLAYVTAAGIMAISYLIIILTGTRAAMAVYPVVIFIMTLYHFRKIHLKSLLVVLLVISGIVFACYKPFIEPKIMQTISEVDRYHEGNDNSSLGSRFSMWIVGLHNGLEAPLGQSMEKRVVVSGEYIKQHPQYKTTMVYINVHLHNEFIDIFSLQGIPGVIVLLFFFTSLMICARSQRNTLLIFSTLMLFLYGLTDVLSTSSEGIIFFITLAALCTLPINNKKLLI